MLMVSSARSLLAASLLALLALGFSGGADAAAKNVATAKATDCVACHGSAKVLPKGHPALKGQKWSNCQTCHAKGSPQALTGKLPMAHAHALAGVDCVACHGKGKPEIVEIDKCSTCHALDALVAKTAGMKHNPHTSPHYGKTLDCTNCHVSHGKPVDFCEQCHSFGFKVP